MKKLITLILIICLIPAFAACSEPAAATEGIKETETEVTAEDAPDENPEPEKAEEAAAAGCPYSDALALIGKAEEYEAALDEELENSDFTQAEMNNSAYRLYESWDNCLNSIWAILKSELPENDMKSLTSDEIQWIQYKDAEVEEVGRDAQGGTIYAALTFSKAAELTKERAYFLTEYLK